MKKTESLDSINKIKVYSENLKKLYLERKENYEFNFDESHNSAVTRFMLEHSHTIYMYCGAMSVFSKHFYDAIAKHDRALSSFLQSEISKPLQSYLEDINRKFKIILEFKKEQDALFDSLILDKKIWAQAKAAKRLEISYLPDALTSKKIINHFSFNEDGNLNRFEQDKDAHSALCIFYPKDKNKNLTENFKKLYKLAIPLDEKTEESEKAEMPEMSM